MARFTLPRDLYYGKGALENLKTLTGKRAIVVSGGSSMRRGGFLDRTEAYLKEAGMEVNEVDKEAFQKTMKTVWDDYASKFENGQYWIDLATSFNK